MAVKWKNRLKATVRSPLIDKIQQLQTPLGAVRRRRPRPKGKDPVRSSARAARAVIQPDVAPSTLPEGRAARRQSQENAPPGRAFVIVKRDQET
jgi:hypothetical protein